MKSMRKAKSRHSFEGSDVLGIDYIECPICGFKCKKITGGHLKAKHGITIKEFRERFGDLPTECESHIKVKSDAEKEYMSDEAFRKHRSEYAKSSWNDEEIRNKRTEGIIRHHADDTFREECRIHSKKIWEDKEIREKTIARMLESNKREDVKENRSNAMLNNWKDDNFRKKVFDGSKRSTEHISWEGNLIHLKSSYEIKCCEYMDSLRLHYTYEPKRFHYYYNKKHHSYYPDFYIKDYDIYLEVKPEKLVGEELNQVKVNSVIREGSNIIFITEKELESKESLLNIIQTSTTIP